MTGRLETLAERRRITAEEAERAHRELMDAVVGELEQAGKVNVRALAAQAGIARATVYNELARRQQTRDTLSGNGHPPPPAPADGDLVDDRPRRPFTLIQSQVLEALADLAAERGAGEHVDRGERVEDVAKVLNGKRGKNVSVTYVRRILRELAEGYSPAPVTAVAARRGRTNFRLTPLELARRAGTNNAGAAGS